MVYSKRSWYSRSPRTFYGGKGKLKKSYKPYKKGYMNGKRRYSQKYKKSTEPLHYDLLNTNDTASLISWTTNSNIVFLAKL